jgi:hypothetical protein
VSEAGASEKAEEKVRVRVRKEKVSDKAKPVG